MGLWLMHTSNFASTHIHFFQKSFSFNTHYSKKLAKNSYKYVHFPVLVYLPAEQWV